MAITQNTLIGKASGSVGGATFSSWKGKNVLRSKPSSVSNPNSPGQLEQRSKLRKAVAFYRSLAAVVNLGFQQMANGMSNYNAFIREALKSGAFSGTDLLPITDFAALQLSKGTLEGVEVSGVTAIAGQSLITLDTELATQEGSLQTDVMRAVAFDANGNNITSQIEPFQRDAESIELNLTRALVAAETIHIYVYAEQPSTRRVSNSQHIAKVVTA